MDERRGGRRPSHLARGAVGPACPAPPLPLRTRRRRRPARAAGPPQRVWRSCPLHARCLGPVYVTGAVATRACTRSRRRPPPGRRRPRRRRNRGRRPRSREPGPPRYRTRTTTTFPQKARRWPSPRRRRRTTRRRRADAPTKTNLNTAGMAELMALPGIGEVRARAIIEYRQDVRLFQSVDGPGGRIGHRMDHRRGPPAPGDGGVAPWP